MRGDVIIKYRNLVKLNRICIIYIIHACVHRKVQWSNMQQFCSSEGQDKQNDLRTCTDSSEPSLMTNVKSSKIMCWPY